MLGGSRHDPLRSPVIDPRCLGGSVDRRAVRLALSTAITVSMGCVVTPDAISSDARSVSACVPRFALSCTDLCRRLVPTQSLCALRGAPSCPRPGRCSRCDLGALHPAPAVAPLEVVYWRAVTVRVRRAGLSPSATSIRVLTATAVSMIAGKIHAVVALYPMACIRSRSARKLTANAPTPMTAVAPTAQQ